MRIDFCKKSMWFLFLSFNFEEYSASAVPLLTLRMRLANEIQIKYIRGFGFYHPVSHQIS